MTRSFRSGLCAAGVTVTLAVGCAKKNDDDPHAGHDHHPKPVGRLEIDQSAVLPVDVKAGVQREYPGAAVQDVKKRTYDDREVRYEVQLMTKDGRQVTRLFDSNGKPAPADAK
jgi:hypothetical protein